MRYLYSLYLLICLVSCKSKNEIILANNNQAVEVLCPEDGVCSFSILKNKVLQVKTDNFGAIYPEISNGKNLVLKFEYKKNKTSNIVDGSYREEVFIELDPNNLETKTTNFSNKKVFFARWCYCKGQTGYYKINDGELSIKKLDDSTFQFKLNFKVEEVPQIIHKINKNFSL